MAARVVAPAGAVSCSGQLRAESITTAIRYASGLVKSSTASTAGDDALDVDRVRAQEFARLGHTVYLDHAGTTLYSERQLKDVYADLAASVLGNPHTNDAMAARIQEARRATLQMLHAAEEQYEVIFTSGATGTAHAQRHA